VEKMVDGLYGLYTRRALPERVPIGAERTGYSQYVSAIEGLRPGAGRVHQAVVEEVRKCAMQARSIPNPVERMIAQVQCAKSIPQVMAGKGFVAFSRRKRSKVKYAPSY
jgi:hypothetical protein